MKKAILLISLVMMLFCMVSCEPAVPPHEHKYSSSWTQDENSHWKGAICEHTDEKISFAVHSMEERVLTEASEGNPQVRFSVCSVCGYTDGTCAIAAVDKDNLPTSFYIPATVEGFAVTSIESNLFEGCSTLTSVIIPQGITDLGNHTFKDCTNLASVTIAESVTAIREGMFQNCVGLTAITLQDSIQCIEDSAFQGCSSLTAITIPDSVTFLGKSALRDCTSLCSVIIQTRTPEPENIDPSEEAPIFGVQSIDDFAFRGCTSLVSITIPESVTRIGAGAFYNCTELTDISISDSVTSIGSYAFRGCTALADVTLPNALETVRTSAFYNCTALTAITIPKSVTKIETLAFSQCTGLASISFDGTQAEWDEVEKADNWVYDIAATTVHCIDGDAEI